MNVWGLNNAGAQKDFSIIHVHAWVGNMVVDNVECRLNSFRAIVIYR